MFSMTIRIEADTPDDLADAFEAVASRGANLETLPADYSGRRASGTVVALDDYRPEGRHA